MKDDEKTAWIILIGIWLFKQLENPVNQAIEKLEQGGVNLYEAVHDDEGHKKDLPEKQLSHPVLLDLATRAGFPDPEMAVAIALAESGGFPSEIANTSREYSVGLWQINLKAHPSYAKEQLLDPGQNALAAFAISKGGTDWRPWSVWWLDASKRVGPGQGRYKLFLRRT